MRKFSKVLFLIISSGFFLFHSCAKEEPALPDNRIAFDSEQLGMSSSEDELTITLNLTRVSSTTAGVSIAMEPTGATYATQFTTDPAPIANSIAVGVPVGATSASFKVKKVDGALFNGDETVKFTLNTPSGGLVLGEKSVLTLTFAEIVASSGTMEVTGGGSLYPNKVFIDLSGNRQTAVLRTAWDLGFSSTDDFRVILNSSDGMMVRALDKADLNSVTAADTVGWGAQLSIAAVFAAITADEPPDWVNSSIAWIDEPSGDLTMTAIAEVSATDGDNKVYIVNRGTGPGTPGAELGWKKIRIVRNGANYTLQHADINATDFSEIQITRDPNYRFQYVNFNDGLVSVEPPETKWDIAWTGFTNKTNFGPPNTPPFYPYYFQDIILQNTSGVETAKIMTSATTYEAFGEADLASLTFGTSQINIGSDWRSGGGPSTAPSIRTDRFYVIKDADGNYYKLRFTALTTNGERGKPQLEYALVKKGT